jgi:oligopeptide/dipeptide ABC transporter ATP-binding protein
MTEPAMVRRDGDIEAPLLRVHDLTVHFPLGRGAVARAVNGVDLGVRRGEVLGVVGESGCGKSTLARAMVRLVSPTSGSVTFDGQDVTHLTGRALRRLRRDMQMIFQDPMASLNPRMPVRDLIGEGLLMHGLAKGAQLHSKTGEILEQVGLPASAAARLPHEFSGGQRQRIGIARALVLEPKLVIADEAVSALDVSVQSQILNLLVELQRDRGLALVFVAHDLAVVDYLSDRIAVMYLGKVVELGTSEQIRSAARHPYTKALLAAAPVPGTRVIPAPLDGDVPSVINPPSGCGFRSRCPMATDLCAQTEPQLRELVGGQQIACHFA